MRLISNVQPKCSVCVDYYRGECHCQKSVYCGMDLEYIPWEGCLCFLSKRKWGCDRPKKKRKKKWPSLAEFEFGV